MGLVAQMKTWSVLHFLLGFNFIISGVIVSFLCLLTWIFVWPFDRILYRKITTCLGYSIWSQFTFLGQWWSGSNCTAQMEKPEDYKYIGKEHTIVVMNHKYDIDWLMAWILSERFAMLGGTKIYGKASLRYVPIIGWLWLFTESIFLKRQWDKDKSIITRDLQGVCAYPDDYWVTLLLFPEGTRFTDQKHQESMEVCRAKGLPELKHHLLPRTKGFVHSMHGLRGKFSAILDMTVGFREDGAKPNLMNVLFGRAIKGEVFVRRIPLETVPEDDEKCAAWLHQLFREKDEIYDNFVQNGTFTLGKRIEVPWRWNDLVMQLFWLCLLTVPTVYYILLYIWNGSWLLKLFFVTATAGLSYFMRVMIGISETHRGSAYGGNKDKNANSKPHKE